MALSVGVAGMLLASNGAYASHGGTSGVLTSTNGTSAIRIQGATSLSTDDTLRDGAWSADGSLMFYVDGGNRISSVRYNDGHTLFFVTLPEDVPANTINSHPTASADGRFVYYASKPNSTSASTINFASVDAAGGDVAVSDAGFDDTHPDFGPGSILVYQKQPDSNGTPTGQADVWGFTTDPQTPSLLVSNAASPSVSPDGTKVAFVRTFGAYKQVFVSDLSGGNLVQVTSDAGSKDNPTWSPDGLTIAFNKGTAVLTAKADGSQKATPFTVSGLSGLPAYRPNVRDHLLRLFGADRYATAIATSQLHWATAGASADHRATANSVVISRSDTYADALGGSALAAAKQGPMLMTSPSFLNAPTATEIQRVLGPANPAKTVYLLGDTTALSASVETSVTNLGYTVVRLAGTDRYDTSVQIAKAINPNPNYILVATGLNFPDALGAGAAAGSYDFAGSDISAVVVLSKNNALTDSPKAFLDANPQATVFGIGTQGLNATAAYNPIDVATGGGFFPANRYTTSMLTAFAFFGSASSETGVATSLNWPDALAGGALMGVLNGPMLISAPGGIDPNIATYLTECSSALNTALVFGSTSVVPAKIASGFASWISGPGGFASSTNPTAMSPMPQSAAPASVRQPNALRAQATGGVKAGNERTPAQIQASLDQLKASAQGK